MTAVRAAGGLRPDNAHVATLVRLNGGWLLVIVAWSRCRRRSLPSPHSNRRRGSNEMGLCSGHPFRPPAGHSFTRIDRVTHNDGRARKTLNVQGMASRSPRSGRGGRSFKSCHSDQHKPIPGPGPSQVAS